MSFRLRDENGQGLIELVAAMSVLSIAIMALMAGYDSSFLSLHRSAQKSVASTLANQQLEIYAALSYAKIGLDQTSLTGIQTPGGSYDARYVSDETSLSETDTDDDGDPMVDTDADGDTPPADVEIAACGASPQCLPVQTITKNGVPYRIETFVRDVTDPNINTGVRWTERIVTVIVQDATTSADTEILRLTTAFDRGP